MKKIAWEVLAILSLTLMFAGCDKIEDTSKVHDYGHESEVTPSQLR